MVDLSIKDVPDGQVEKLRAQAKANHRSLQGELRALIEAATSSVARPMRVDEVAAQVRRLGLTRRDEARAFVRADRDR
jgi:plasmid stability protein